VTYRKTPPPPDRAYGELKRELVRAEIAARKATEAHAGAIRRRDNAIVRAAGAGFTTRELAQIARLAVGTIHGIVSRARRS
jgi:DNA-directed RNA polymerase specialized sigma24 family protein